jgi:hypothetical protein
MLNTHHCDIGTFREIHYHHDIGISASYGIDLAVCLYVLLKDEPNQRRPNLGHGSGQGPPAYLNEFCCTS